MEYIDFKKNRRKYFEAGDKLLKDYVKEKQLFEYGKCEYIKQFKFKNGHYTKSNADHRKTQMNNYIIPIWGDLYLSEIEARKVENWLTTKINSSKQQILHIKSVFSIIMSEAVGDGIIQFNPIKSIKLGKIRGRRKREVFTIEELKTIFPASDEEILDVWDSWFYSALNFIALSGGLRSQEVRALTWKDILWDEGIWMRSAITADEEKGTLKCREETEGQGVYLPSRAFYLLRKWKEDSHKQAPDDYVFFGRDCSKPIGRKMILIKFHEVIDRLFPEKKGKNYVFHSWRHTYRTITDEYLSKGMIMDMMGHKSEEVSEIYNQNSELKRMRKYKEEKAT